MIRLVEMSDYEKIVDLLRKNEKIDYLTEKHVLSDILNKKMYCVDEDGIKAIGALVYDPEYGMHYIKRVMAFSKGNGYGKEIISFLSNSVPVVAVTPFKNNHKMKKILKNEGFRYKYSFLENFELFVKKR